MPKVKDISPSLGRFLSAEEELSLDPGVMELGQRIGGLSTHSNSFKRGYGDNTFGSDENGIWLGSADFENGNFKVAMNGSVLIKGDEGRFQIDSENNRLVIYDENDVPRVLIGFQLNGF